MDTANADGTINADAEPHKSFFIDTLTKDISLESCILDLIDNSIDSIITKAKFDPIKELEDKNRNKLDSFKINITLNKNEFKISDNAAGIPLELAQKSVFRIGSEPGKEDKIVGLSVYGIGLKRAIFKFGSKVKMDSTSEKGRWSLDWDIDKWRKDDHNWKIPITETEKQSKADKDGTLLIITRLGKEVRAMFTEDSFTRGVLRKIESAYALFIHAGLKINVNNKTASLTLPNMRRDKSRNSSYHATAHFESGGTKVFIAAGFSGQLGAKEADIKKNGWYVFCNGRMVLQANKDEMTGWGSKIRAFHPSVSQFVGLVYFTSTKEEALPWKTTKDGIVFDSPIYQKALNEMGIIADPIVKYLARRYKVKGNDELKVFSEIEAQSESVSIIEIGTKESFFSPVEPVKSSAELEQSIKYTVSKKDFERAREACGNKKISANKLGELTFHYYLDRES